MLSFMDAIDSQGLEPRRIVTRETGPDEASALILFRSPDGGRPVGVPVTWVRVEGRWYAQPKVYRLPPKE